MDAVGRLARGVAAGSSARGPVVPPWAATLTGAFAPVPVAWLRAQGLLGAYGRRAGWTHVGGLAWPAAPTPWARYCAGHPHAPWAVWSVLRAFELDGPGVETVELVADPRGRTLGRFGGRVVTWRRRCVTDWVARLCRSGPRVCVPG